MSNKGVFEQALEKVAAIPTVNRPKDPLYDPDLGPSSAGRLGQTIGGLAGGLGGAILGGHYGAELGVGERGTAFGDIAGGLAMGSAGAIGGGLAGKAIGKRVGGAIHEAVRPHSMGVSKVRSMSMPDALAYIRQAEEQGRMSPRELQGMKDAYNARRRMIQHQLAVGGL